MFNFTHFLEEQAEAKPLKHLTHLEDNIIHNGHEGVGVAAQHLDDVSSALEGKKTTTHISTKFDGAPSIVFGTHPTTGRFFVGTKSVFNKTPKINYTPEDIDNNHGHAPGLVEKLKQALEHLPKIMPREGGVYQGDLMHTPEDIETKNGMHSFTPNTITYSVPKDSAAGKSIKNSKLGVVVHTKYSGAKNLEGMSAGPLGLKERQKFNSHPDVHNIDPTINVTPSNYTPEERAEFAKHKEAVRQSYSKMKPEAMDALEGHGINLEAHINKMIREGGQPSTEGYIKDLTDKAKKSIDSVKTEKAKDIKAKEHSALVNQVEQNRKHFDKALEIHGHLQKAKDVLTKVMAKNNQFTHTIAGEPTGPEGAVAVDKNGNMTKFVDRQEFSRQNFLRSKMSAAPKTQVNESLGATTSSEHRTIHNAFRRSVHIQPRSGSEQIPVRSSVGAARSQHQQYAALTKNKIKVREEIELEEAKSNKLVMNFGRMSPIHEGHGEVIRTVVGLANRTGADHKVIMSHTQDPKKNPLTPQQKLKHARRAFPGVNFDVSSPAQPSLLHHLSKAHADGYKEVTVVGGSDRDTMGQMAQRYNGVKGPHGYYNMKLNFAQAGANREEGGSGVASYSASKMRDAASKNDFDSFKSMAPKTMSTPHAKDMFTDTRKGMKLESFTPSKFSEFIIG